MSAGNVMNAERIAAAFLTSIADPLPLTHFEIGMAMYRHWLGATLRLFEDQCAHFQNLAECDDPLNMLVCQIEFAEKSFAAIVEELRRGVDIDLTDLPVRNRAESYVFGSRIQAGSEKNSTTTGNTHCTPRGKAFNP
ncbi:hypothetical protein [Shinella sp. G-2]|uniref:hypothetical protein n=1 Tax=Shinella sp. G-2 TaxID=3133141 RepID=UPI003CFC13B7